MEIELITTHGDIMGMVLVAFEDGNREVYGIFDEDKTGRELGI